MMDAVELERVINEAHLRGTFDALDVLLGQLAELRRLALDALERGA